LAGIDHLDHHPRLQQTKQIVDLLVTEGGRLQQLRTVVTAAKTRVSIVDAVAGEVPEHLVHQLPLVALHPVVEMGPHVGRAGTLVQDQDVIEPPGELQHVLHVLGVEFAPGERAGVLVLGDGNDDGKIHDDLCEVELQHDTPGGARQPRARLCNQLIAESTQAGVMRYPFTR